MKTFSLDAEHAVLGSIMLGGKKIFDQVSPMIGEQDFFGSGHGFIFSAMAEAVERKQPVDPVTLAEVMGADRLEAIGGMSKLSDLCLQTPSSANAKVYTRIVLDCSHLRALAGAGASIIELANGGEDSPAEKIAQAQDIVQNLAKTNRSDDKNFKQATKEFIQWLQREDSELQSGFFDQHTGGLFPGLITIAAGTGQGKTTLALNIAYNLRDKNIAYYTLEMPAQQVVGRMISNHSGLPYARIRDKNLNQTEWDVMESSVKAFMDLPIRFVDGGIHINQICAHARGMKNNQGLDLVIVDYIQLVGSDGYNREREIANITRKLKCLSMDLNVPIIALSQLSREHEKRNNPRPTLRDLRESGAIEQDSDLVMFLYDESKYRESTNYNGLTELYSCKFRHGENFSMALNQELANYRFSVSHTVINQPSATVYKL